MVSLRGKNERRSRAVTTARITRAPADRKLPLIASQTFILHPEYPRLLSLFLSLSLCLSIKSPAIKVNRISLYHPSFVPRLTKADASLSRSTRLGCHRYTSLHDRAWSGFVHSERIRGFDGRHASMRYFPSAIETPSASIRERVRREKGSVTITRIVRQRLVIAVTVVEKKQSEISCSLSLHFSLSSK